MKFIAPPHTPFNSRGELTLEVVEAQARHFRDTGYALGARGAVGSS